MCVCMCAHARTHVSIRIDVCKIIRVRVANTRDGIASGTRTGSGRGAGGERGGGGRINRLKLMTYVSESAFCATVQRLRTMILDNGDNIDFFRSCAAQSILHVGNLLLSLPVVLKRGRMVLERIRERYAIYCVTLHVIIIVVDLFLEFLSDVTATLGQLKTRVPTVGAYIMSKVLIKGRVMEVIVGRRVQIGL